MKKYSEIYVFVFVFAFCCLFIGVVSAQDLSSDLEGYWSFDDFDGTLAEDVSGNGRDADVLAGEPLPAAGRKGNGIFLDGSSDFQVPWEGVQGNDPRTIVCWIKTTDVGGGMVGWGQTGTAVKWHFRVNNSTNQPDESTFGCIRTEYQGSQTIASTPVNDGEWHFVASVFEGLHPSDVVHYVDGELDPNGWVGDDTLEIDTTTTSEEENVTIGSRRQGTSYERVTGTMDEVRIYSRALSADEIKALYEEVAEIVQLVAERSFSQPHVGPDGSIEVSLSIPEGAEGLTLTEEIPDGWTASDISDGGSLDGNTITWEIASGQTSASYTATASEGAEDAFHGNLDGIITGGDLKVTILKGAVGEFEFHADIGDTGVEGDSSFSNGEYVIQGGGADIWNTADGFHFAFNEIEGPFVMRGNAILFNIDSTNDWSKGGLMVRNNLTPGSSYGYNLVRGVDLQMTSQARSSQNDSAFTVVDLVDDQFGDMEIERVGKVINYYYIDLDGDRVPFGSVELEDLEDPVYAGLACTSHEVGALSELIFMDYELELLDYSAVRTINIPNEAGLLFGESAEVSIHIFFRDSQDVNVTEDIPEGWTVSAIETTAGEASVNGDGDVAWTIADFEGEATISYEVTAPEESDSAVISAEISGTANGNDIEGSTELFARGFVSQEIIDQQDIESNLELYLSFDNWDGTVAEDLTDNGYDASLITDGESPSTDDAIIGQALDFDDNTTLSVPWTGVQGNTPRTIALWMKTTEGGPIFVAWGNNIGGEKWHFRINDNAGNGNVDAIRTEFAGGNQTVATSPVNDGEWHHIASVFEGEHPQDVKHYVDGLFDPNTWSVEPDTIIDTLSDENNNVHIGSDPGGGRMFGGVMDELRIYSRALSHEEIQALFLSEGGEPQTSVADYMLY